MSFFLIYPQRISYYLIQHLQEGSYSFPSYSGGGEFLKDQNKHVQTSLAHQCQEYQGRANLTEQKTCLLLTAFILQSCFINEF